MLRSPSLVVRRERAGRRKEIVTCQYHQPSHASSTSYYLDLLDHTLELLSFAGLLCVSSYALNKRVEPAVDTSDALKAVSASSWVLLTVCALLPLRLLRSLPGRRALELGLTGVLQLLAFATLSTIGYGHYLVGRNSPQAHYDPDRYRWSFGVVEIVAAAVLAGCAVVHTVLFRTIGGLYAPICPSVHAPTLIPVFLIQVSWTVLLTVAFGLAIHPDHEDMRETVNVLRVVAFALAVLQAWGELCITRVIQKNGLKRCKRQQKKTAPMPSDELPYKRPSQTPTNDI